MAGKDCDWQAWQKAGRTVADKKGRQQGVQKTERMADREDDREGWGKREKKEE